MLIAKIGEMRVELSREDICIEHCLKVESQLGFGTLMLKREDLRIS